MRNALINLNGAFHGFETAKISVFDRSFLFGDSLYEVVRTYKGKPFGLTEHVERLKNSAKLCLMDLGRSVETLETEVRRTLQEHQKRLGRADAELYCRMVVSRGSGRIGFGLKQLETPPLVVIISQPLEDFLTGVDFEKGSRLRVSDRLRNHPRALDPAMKSGNYLNSLLAFLDAQSAGYDDALLCDGFGHITEGTTFNIFYVRRGIVATPPLDIGILDGITRRLTLEICRRSNVEARETRFPKERLYEADEVFLTSTTKEVFPIVSVDGKKIGSGKPGPITRMLSEQFHAEASRRAR